MPSQVRWMFLCALLVSAACVMAKEPAQADDANAVRFVQPNVLKHGANFDQLFNQTTSLEKEQRWGEALQLYSDAIRSNPDNPAIRQRQLLAQIHYDLNRRYSDNSFRNTVRETDSSHALAVYAEVLNKIETYHVQTPDWARITALGAQSLEVALSDPAFIGFHAPQITDLQAATASQVVRQTLDHFAVKNNQDAYVVTSSLARQLEARIGLSPAATIYEFIFGSMIALDPYSSFMTETQFNETMSQIEGSFVGLGVELKTMPKKLEIVSVIPDGSAGKAGLQPGDLVLAVDDQLTEKIGSEAAADMMRGLEGTAIALTIQRGSQVQRMSLVRRQVEIPSIIDAHMLEPGIGYIHIASFQKTTTRDFDAAIWRMNQQGLNGLIVDVRGNPGGLLSASVEIADRFIQSGIVVSTRGRNPLEDFVHHAVANGTWTVPLVVLVDENSASASEIFAAAIADHKRGRIVGTRSYGKGSVQGIFPLSVSGGGIRLTTAKFFGPNGEAIQNNGVKPDVEVHAVAKVSPNSTVDATNESDAALTVGLKIVRLSAVR